MTDSAVAQAPTDTKSSNTPAFKMKLGNISIALFSGEKSTADGKTFLAQDIVVEKSWKNSDGSYDSRKLSLDPKDVMKVITGLNQAYLAANDERNG